MKKNSSLVQTIVLVVFGLGIGLGVLVLSGNISIGGNASDTEGPTGNVLVWGVLPRGEMETLFTYIEGQYKNLEVTYVEKTPESLQTDLVNALASGVGPDIFMIPPGQVAENMDRLAIIPFASYSKSTYQNTFTEIGDSLLVPTGFVAFPAFIDPMIMYYNRDMLTSAFKTEAPKTWAELDEIVPLLTKRNDAGVIQQSAVALGTGNNITHASDILYTRLLQQKNSIVFINEQGWDTSISVGLAENIDWFTRYGQPSNQLYAWNQSLPQDREAFTAGILGFYFGYPSEIISIREKNPNLNFRVAMMPQIENTQYRAVYGQLYSIGVSKISKNVNSAIQLASIMVSKDNLEFMIEGTFYAPARKDLYTSRPSDNPEKSMVLDSGVISKTFLNPKMSETRRIITNNINQLNAGTRNYNQVIMSIENGFRDLLRTIKIPE
jgi:ABC-type glycerol-3-phosphate transport system substrate-binding protein